MAFTDRNGNRILDTEDEMVAELPGFAHATIRWRAFRNRSYLRFTTQGLTDSHNGNFLFCNSDPKPQLARQITLNYAGRLYRAPTATRIEYIKILQALHYGVISCRN